MTDSERKHRVQHLVPGDKLEELITRKGTVSAAAKLIGYEASTISGWRSRNDGKIPLPADLAARYILSLEDTKREHFLVIARVPREKKTLLDTFLKGLDIKHMTFTD